MLSTRTRMWIKRIAIAALVPIASLAVVLLSLTLPPVRDGVARRAVRTLSESLPGTLRVAQVRWGLPMDLELDSVEWQHDGSQLFSARRIQLRFELSALVSRDLVVERLALEDIRANVPGIVAAFPAPADALPGAQPPADPGRAGVPFVRAGAIPGLPSVLLRTLWIDAPHVALTATDRLENARLVGRVDVVAGHRPIVDLEQVQARLEPRGIELGPGHLTIDLQRGTIDAALEGQLGSRGPFTLRSSGSDIDRFDLDLELPAMGVEAEAQGRWRRRGARPIGLHVVSETRITAGADSGLAGLEPWLPGRLMLEADVELEGDLRGSGSVELGIGQSWFDEVAATFRFGDQAFQAESLRVRLDGLDVDGAFAWSNGEIRSKLEGRVRGAEWMRAWSDAPALPDSLRMDVLVEAAGPPRQARGSMQIRGAVQASGVRFDSLSVDVRLHEGLEQPVEWDLYAEAGSYGVDAGGTVSLSEPTRLRAELRPVVVQALGRRGAPDAASASANDAATVEYDRRTRRARIDRLRMSGDWGEFVASAQFDAETGGRAECAARWPSPPLAAGLADSTAAALRASWPTDSIPEVRLQARLGGESDGFSSRINGAFHLPGPAMLRALLPEGVDFAGWDRLEGRFSADVGDSIVAKLDLGATPWIDTCFVQLSHHGERTRLDTLRLRVEGVSLDAQLVHENEQLRGGLRSRGDRPALLARFAALTDTLQATWSASATCAGRRDAPRWTAEAEARMEATTWKIPAAQARFEIERGRRAAVDVDLPGGLTSTRTPFRLDSLQLRYETVGTTAKNWLRDGTLRMSFGGPDMGGSETAHVDLQDHVEVRFDSLMLRLQDRDLRSARPFTLRQLPGARSFVVERMQLEGSMGVVSLHCRTSPDSLTLDLDARLDVPAKPEWLNVPQATWPTRLTLVAAATAHDDVRVEAGLSGFALTDTSALKLDMQLQPALVASPSGTKKRGFDARLSIVGQDTLVTAAALLPLRFEQFPMQAHTLDDSVRVRARWQRLPFATRLPPEGLTAYLDSSQPKPHVSGQLDVSGRGVAPDFDLDASLTVPVEGAQSYAIRLQARGNGAERTRGELAIRRAQRVMAAGRLDLPLRFTFAPFGIGLREDELSFDLRADSLDIAELTPILPAGVTARGQLNARFSASGPAVDPRLEGDVSLAGLEFEVTGRRSVSLNFAARLGGTARAPDVSGTLRITSARLTIPERRNLLPTEGEPVLWAAIDADSLTPSRTIEKQPASDRLPVPPGAKVALKIDVPSGFWILGRDLGIELKGDLEAGIENQVPVVQGNLEAIQGWFTLLGRNFELVKGRCDFIGTNTFNPTLNIEMRTKVRDTTIFVAIRGDVEEPELELRSEPTLSEGDIMGVLVFGRSPDQQGSGEGDFVAAQVAALAQSYSGAALQQVLGNQFGVDTVRFKSPSGDDGQGTSLEVGKYLTRSVLLQYEIDLQTGRGRGVRMEYRISDRLKLDSHVSHDVSGIEFNWSKNY